MCFIKQIQLLKNCLKSRGQACELSGAAATAEQPAATAAHMPSQGSGRATFVAMETNYLLGVLAVPSRSIDERWRGRNTITYAQPRMPCELLHLLLAGWAWAPSLYHTR
jgi:hypothetical protein